MNFLQDSECPDELCNSRILTTRWRCNHFPQKLSFNFNPLWRGILLWMNEIHERYGFVSSFSIHSIWSPSFWLKNAVLGIERQAACHPLPCFPGSADPIWPLLLFTATGNRHTSLAQRKVSTFQPDLQNTSQADLTCRILVYTTSWASYQF